jgi:outer membrane lipoprotein-sorting protein
MKRTHNHLLFILMPAFLFSVCACNNVDNKTVKNIDNAESSTDSSSITSGDTITAMVDGHKIQIVKDDPNTLVIDGQKMQVASYSESERPVSDSLVGGTISTSVVNGNKVTVYDNSSCTRRDTVKRPNPSLH